MNLDKAISEWRNQMRAAGINRPEILDELENHLREDVRSLMRLGQSEAEAFQRAVSNMGEGKLLNKEYAKTGANRRLRVPDNPMSLNLIGIWFIVCGLNAIMTIWEDFRTMLMNWRNFVEIGLILILCSQLLIGLGLLRRKTVWRGVALNWCRWEIILYVCSEIYVCLLSSQPFPFRSSLGISSVGLSVHQSFTYLFLGMPLPLPWLFIISYLNIGIMGWAYYSLSRPSARKLFRLSEKSEAN